MLSIEAVTNIIVKELKQSDYAVDVKRMDSKSSQSCYFSIKGDSGVSMLFRISDHPTKKNVMTLRVDKKLNKQQVQRFVHNRVKDLKQRTLKVLLENC